LKEAIPFRDNLEPTFLLLFQSGGVFCGPPEGLLWSLGRSNPVYLAKLPKLSIDLGRVNLRHQRVFVASICSRATVIEAWRTKRNDGTLGKRLWYHLSELSSCELPGIRLREGHKSTEWCCGPRPTCFLQSSAQPRFRCIFTSMYPRCGMFSKTSYSIDNTTGQLWDDNVQWGREPIQFLIYIYDFYRSAK
jgi:hypothetical protein